MQQQRHPKQKRKIRRSVSISRIIALSFLGIILLGTCLLSLPAASRSGRSAGFLTSLFTATSATCVTGLVMGDTYTLWSPFGQIVILVMIQIGGLGFMSVASLAYFTLRMKIGMRSGWGCSIRCPPSATRVLISWGCGPPAPALCCTIRIRWSA